MIPVIIASNNRPELLKQTVESAMMNTKIPIHVIIVDDASTNQQTLDYLESLRGKDNITVMCMPDPKACGATKNAGAAIADPAEYIYFSDNDVYFHENWLEDMIKVLHDDPSIGILGGDRHPHHGIISTHDGAIYSDQQVGFSMLMRQDVWRKVGAFVHGALGVYGHEDTHICNVAKDQGYQVAAMQKRVLTHCGLTNSSGGEAAGYPDFAAQEVPEGVIRI